MNKQDARLLYDYIVKAMRNNVPIGENPIEQNTFSAALSAFQDEVTAPPEPPAKPVRPDRQPGDEPPFQP